MKKALLFVAGVIFLANVQSQELQLTLGQKITTETILYANKLPLDSKWGKLNDDKRDELVVELNDKIIAGTVEPSHISVAKFEVIDVKNANGAAQFTLKAYDSGFEYQTTNYFTKDTALLVRNADPVFSVNKGDTLGMSIQGIQRIPANLKVGDKLPQYTDLGFTFPETWTSKMTEKVYAGRKTETKNEFGYMKDDNTGEYSLGNFKVTTTIAIYDNISHDVQITENINSSIIHYFSASCTGTENMNINGKEQTTYIIESQRWAKSKINREYTAERQDLANKKEAEFEKFMEKAAKKTARRKHTNPEGYVVTYLKEWFLPGFGMVQTESYDHHGAIQSYTKIIF